MTPTPTDTETTKRPRGRPRKPELIATGEGYSVRYWRMEEGTLVRRQEPLHTQSKVVARARMKEVVAGLTDVRSLGAIETFEAAARRIVPTQALRGTGRKDRMSRLERFAFPVIGKKRVTDITSVHVKDVIDDAIQHHGGKRSTGVKHLFIDIKRVLGALHEDNVIAENVCARIKFGGVEPVKDPPCVPTMDEFERMAGHHLALAEQRGEGLPEVLVMAISSRCLGGMRTSDLHAWCFEHIDTLEWQSALVPRPKKKKDTSQALFSMARHAIPSDLVPILFAWWSQLGSPMRGPVFPMRRDRVLKTEAGEGGALVVTKRVAGSRKGGNISYAKKLRDLFWTAGVFRPIAGFEDAWREWQRLERQVERSEAAGDRRQAAYDRRRADEAEAAARELCELQSGGEGCGPVDFHSLRRAYVTDAAHDESLSLQAAMELVDHADPKTHLGYKAKTRVLVAPEKIIPRIVARHVPELPSGGKKKSNDYGRVRRDSNAGPTASEAGGEGAPSGFSRGFSGEHPLVKHHETAPAATRRQKPAPVIRRHEATPPDALREAIAEAMDRGDLEEARDLLDVARRRAAVTPKAAE